MRSGKLFLLITAIAAILCGCAEIKEYAAIAVDERFSEDYLNALAKWTREKTVYSEFETRLKIVATWKNKEFVNAYRDRYAELYDISDREKATKCPVAESGSTEFLFYAYTPDRDANTFSKPDSIWKIYLIDGRGNRHAPVALQEVENVSPVITEFYPYVQPSYGKTYTVSFTPDLVEEENITLVFTSVLARAELIWRGLRTISPRDFRDQKQALIPAYVLH